MIVKKMLCFLKPRLRKLDPKIIGHLESRQVALRSFWFLFLPFWV